MKELPMRVMSLVCVRNAAIVVLLVAGGILASCGGEENGTVGLGYHPDGEAHGQLLRQ
jgi:hypothetical protein